MPQPLEYAAARPRKPLYRLTLGEWLVMVGIIALMISILLPILNRARNSGGSVPCASNLRQIGQAIQLYALSNGGSYPPDFGALLVAQQIAPKVFLCPSTSDTKATGKTPQAQAADLKKPGRCSYVYIAGLNTSSNPDCVLAIEDPGNHMDEGAFVLFADGHVEFWDLWAIVEVLNDLDAGINPSTTRSGLSVQKARQMYNTTWKPRMPQLKTGPWVIPATRPAQAATTNPATP